MVKYGAILAQGMTISLQYRTVPTARQVRILGFTQYWYRFPLGQCFFLVFWNDL